MAVAVDVVEASGRCACESGKKGTKRRASAARICWRGDPDWEDGQHRPSDASGVHGVRLPLALHPRMDGRCARPPS